MRIWLDHGGVKGCPFACPGLSGLHPILPAFHVPSCGLAQWGSSHSQKNSLILRGTLQSQAEHLGAKHLYYATWKARSLHSWDAYTLRDLLAHLSPQPPLLLEFTFLKEVQKLNHPWTSPFFKGNSMHTSFFPDRPTNLWTNTALVWNDMRKSDAGR